MTAPITAPTVSIGMPVYNGEAHIESALKAIVSQTFRDFELIVSDNASTDGTERICRRVAAADPRVRYIRHTTNIGVQANFRFVLDNSAGPYFAWAAHDDLWDEHYLECLVRILRDRPEVVLAFSRFDNIDGAGRVIKRHDTDWNAAWRLPKFWQLWSFVMQDPGQTQKANHIYGLIRRAALVRSDAFFTYDVFAGADSLHLFALLCCGEFAVEDEVLFHYRVRPSVGPPRGAGLAYLWNRAFRSVAGHRGNLVDAVRKHHYYYRSLRRMALATQLPWPQRTALAGLIATREVERLATQVPRAVAQELFRRPSAG